MACLARVKGIGINMDYAKVWFVFWAVLWAGYFALDGFDLGVGFSGWVVWRELCLPLIQGGPVFGESFSLARVPACAW